MMILYTALKSVPRDVVEAAILDDTPLWKIILRVKLPHGPPGHRACWSSSTRIGALQLFTEPLILDVLPARGGLGQLHPRRSTSTTPPSPAASTTWPPRRRGAGRGHRGDLGRLAAVPPPEGESLMSAFTLSPRARDAPSQRRERRRRERLQEEAAASRSSSTGCAAAPSRVLTALCVAVRDLHADPDRLDPDQLHQDPGQRLRDVRVLVRPAVRVLPQLLAAVPERRRRTASTSSGLATPRCTPLAGGIGATALAAFAGYGFARFRFRGSRSLFYLVIVGPAGPDHRDHAAAVPDLRQGRT